MLLDILLLQHTSANCTGCFWCWAIWMLLSLLLGIGIGKWIWGKYAMLIKQKEAELIALRNKNTQLEKDFIDNKYQIVEVEKDNAGLKASLADAERNIIALSTQIARIRKEKNEQQVSKKIVKKAATEIKEELVKQASIGTEDITSSKPTELTEDNITLVNTREKENSTNNLISNYGAYLKKDDLKIVEGIGPKIENILNLAAIKTWKDLAKTTYSDLQNIMHDAGPRYRIHDPKTWNRQAQLADEKKWEALIILQKELYEKRTNNEDKQGIPPAKIEKLIAKKLGFESIASNDLKIIEGIGPKIESLLKANDISNWKDLSTAPIEQLQGILEDAGNRFRLADPSTWAKQAILATEAKWIELKEYQDLLINGKR